MKKQLIFTLLISSTLLTGCCFKHEYSQPTCTQPATCIKCGEIQGEVIPHTWKEATCTEPKQCSVCNLTEGEPLGHKLSEPTCTESSKCEVCNIVIGEPLNHDWKDADYDNPKTCQLCGLTEGEPLEYKGDNPYDQGVSPSDQEAIEDMAQQIIADYLREHAQDTQVDVDVPGGTPASEATEQESNLGKGGELPPELQGGVTQ